MFVTEKVKIVDLLAPAVKTMFLFVAVLMQIFHALVLVLAKNSLSSGDPSTGCFHGVGRACVRVSVIGTYCLLLRVMASFPNSYRPRRGLYMCESHVLSLSALCRGYSVQG